MNQSYELNVMMWRIALVSCLVGVVLGGPSVVKSREEIEEFRSFLENGRTDDGFLLKTKMASNPKASAWEMSGKYQGDILLDEEQVQGMVEAFAGGRNAYIFPNTKWPGDTIVYEIDTSFFNPEQVAAILFAIEDIESHTCLRFRERENNERVFVRVTGRPDGCYAHVGYWNTRGVHTLNLTPSAPGTGCFRHTTIVHEWNHIFGFLHMQSTYNRDDYVEIVWDNILPGMEHNFNKYEADLVSNLGLPYEYASCMHYGAYGFSINGDPTIVALHDFDGVMGQQEYVTDWDWLRINRHYDCPGAWDEDRQ